MDFLRNYTGDQEESEDSVRERTTTPTSSSSSTTAKSPRRIVSSKRHDRQKGAVQKDAHPRKVPEKKYKGQGSRKEFNEISCSASSDDDRASRGCSRSQTSDDSSSKFSSHGAVSTQRSNNSRNDDTKRKAANKNPFGECCNNEQRKLHSYSSRQRQSAVSAPSTSRNESPAKVNQKEKIKSSPTKRDLRRYDRNNSREPSRKNRERERDRNRECHYGRERDHERNRDKERKRDRDHNRDHERERIRDRDRIRNGRERDRDRNRDRDRTHDSRVGFRDQRRVGVSRKSNDRDNSQRDSRPYNRKDDRKGKRDINEYNKDCRRSHRSSSRESRNMKRQSPNDRMSSKTCDSRSRSRSRSRSCSKSSIQHITQAQTPTLPQLADGFLPTTSRISQNIPTLTKLTSLLPTPTIPQSLLGPIPLASSVGIPSLMSIATKPPIKSLIPTAVAAKLNLTNELKLGQVALPLASTQDPMASGVMLSRSALLRNNAKAAQLEKMGIDVLQQNQKAVDSIPLPSYYNPGVVNPVRYADQVQKRKLLWSHKSNESKEVSSNISKWEQAKFAQDTDGSVASKFLRLMGVKDSLPKRSDDVGSSVLSMASASALSITAPAGSELIGSCVTSSNGEKQTGDSIKKQEELFTTMEQQYEVARQVTHTMRGVGLGFSSQARQF